MLSKDQIIIINCRTKSLTSNFAATGATDVVSAQG